MLCLSGDRLQAVEKQDVGEEFQGLGRALKEFGKRPKQRKND